MLARLFVLVGSLIVLALTVALVGPYFIDWTSYRADFEREASRILGRQVIVDGRAKARLLPFPSLTFSDVKVAGDAPDRPALTAETFSMDIELAPFLRGEILIFDMRIVKPRAFVEIAEDGRLNWTARPAARFNPGQISVERISVTDGEVILRHGPGRREHRITDLRSVLSAQTLAGPWRMEGSLAFDGVPVRIGISTGTVAADGSMRMRIQARPQPYAIAIETDGDARIADGALTYAGLFRLENLSETERISDDEDASFSVSIEAPGERRPFSYRVTGAFGFDQRLLSIEEFRLETGPVEDPYIANGSAFVDLGSQPRFSVKAEGQQMRLDEAPPNGKPGALPLELRLRAVRAAIAALPHPNIPGTVEFMLPAIVAGDTTIRQLSLKAVPRADGWQIDDLSAELPGRSTLEAKGFLATGEEFGFHGSLLLAVAQPSGFAAWLSEDVDGAIRRLPAAGFSADVSISDRRQSFRDLELILGDARFTGEIDHHVPGDARPSMLLRLEGGKLDLDGLLAFASLFVDDAGRTRLADHNLDLALRAGPVKAGGITATEVDAALRLRDGQLDIDRLSIADVAGATFGATGRIRGIPNSPAGSLDASIVAVDLAPLVRLVAGRYPGSPFAREALRRLDIEPELLADANLSLVATAATNDDDTFGLAVSAHGVAGGGEFSAAGSATRSEGAFAGPVSLSLSLRNDDAARVFAAAGFPALPLGLVGPAEANLSLRGDPGGSMAIEAGLRGEGMRTTFAGTVGLADGGPRIEGRAEVTTDDIAPWLATAGAPVIGFGQGVSVELSALLDHSASKLAIRELSGRVAHQTVGAELEVALDGALPAVSGRISAESMNVAPLVSMLLGADAMPDSGAGWAGRPFATDPRLPFTGEVELAVERLDTGFGPSLGRAGLRLSAAGDAIRIADLDARLGEGALAGLIEMRNDSGTGLVSGQLSLSDASLSFGGPAFGVEARADAAANLTASGKSFTALVASLAGSGSAALSNLAIRGIDPDAFAAILAAADEGGDDGGPERAAALAGELLRSGRLDAGETRLAFVVSGGMARTPTLVLRHPDARLEAAFDVDLASGTLSGDGELVFEPGREALVGAEPSVRLALSGPLVEPAVEFDTGPLSRYLTQRALEFEQYRVEAMQARLLERQRLRREARYYMSLPGDRRTTGTMRGAARSGEQGEAMSGAPGPGAKAIQPDPAEAGGDGQAIVHRALPEISDRLPPEPRLDAPVDLRPPNDRRTTGEAAEGEGRGILRRLFDRFRSEGQ